MTSDSGSSVRRSQIVAVVLAGGQGRRAGAGINKVLLDLAGTAVLVRAVAPFADCAYVDRIIVVAHADDRAQIEELLRASFPLEPIPVIPGGPQRPDSERQALELLRSEIRSGAVSAVLIHDGARPLVTTNLVAKVIEATFGHGGAIPGRPVRALVRVGTTDRADAYVAVDGATVRVQTPQGFIAPALLAAYDFAAAEGFTGTDTSSYVEHHRQHLPPDEHERLQIELIDGPANNLKITWSSDLPRAVTLLRQSEV